MATSAFSPQASTGFFEFVHTPSITTTGDFDEAIKGASAVIYVYVASINIDANPYNVIPLNNAAILNDLRAAVKDHSVKPFTHTSSVGEAFMPVAPGSESLHISPSSWNEEALAETWALPPYEPSRLLSVYKAEKVKAEKTV